MAIDEQHVALPKLYGSPAYARPAMPVEATERPLDPDDLPIVAAQSLEERELAEALFTGQQAARPASAEHDRQLRPRILSLRSLAGRILSNGES